MELNKDMSKSQIETTLMKTLISTHPEILRGDVPFEIIKGRVEAIADWFEQRKST